MWNNRLTKQPAFYTPSGSFVMLYKGILVTLVILMTLSFAIITPLSVKAVHFGSSSEENEVEEECDLIERLSEAMQGANLMRHALRLKGFYFREMDGEEVLFVRFWNVTSENLPTRISISFTEVNTGRSIFPMLSDVSFPADSYSDIRTWAVKEEFAAGEHAIEISVTSERRPNQQWEREIPFYVDPDGNWIWEEGTLIEVDIEELERIEAQRARMERFDLDLQQRILILGAILLLFFLVVLLSTRRENAIAQGLRRKSIFKMGLFFLLLVLPVGYVFLFGFTPRGVGLLIGGGFVFIIMSPFIRMKWETISKSEYMKGIEDFANRSSDPWKMMKQLEFTWRKGKRITNACRVDDEFFLFGDGTFSGAVQWEEVEKVEMRSHVIRGGRGVHFEKRYMHGLRLQIHLKSDEMKSFPMASITIPTDETPAHFNKITKELFDYITKHHPSIVLEKFNDDTAKEMEAFVKEMDGAENNDGV